MKKLIKHVYGTHAFIKIKLDDGEVVEFDVFWTENGEVFKIPEQWKNRAAEIKTAFNILF